MFLSPYPSKTINKFKLNVFKLVVLLVTMGLCAKAQNTWYQPISVGVGYGVTIARAGEQTQTSSNATNFNLNYQFTPFVSIGFDAQFGTLSGGDAEHDTYGKQFLNNYKSFILHADVQAGEFIDYSHNAFLNKLKNVYAGIGIGMLSNKISNITTLNPVDSSTLTYTPGSSNLLIPLRIGYEFKLFNQHDEPQFRFDINYSFNTAFGAGLDGYTSVYTKSYIKFYNYISVGFKYCFGPLKAYRKQIYYDAF
jgi:hypothetical protein